MKSGIGTEIHYYCNNNNVACVIDVKNRYNYLLSQMQDIGDLLDGAGISYKRKEIPDRFTGIARLKNGDKKNFELAKEVARRKAVRQMYKIYANEYITMLAYLSDALRQYHHVYYEIIERINNIDHEIKDMLSNESQG